ncbi:MAG: Rpn family recombination-promoting nuclease/putative transposase [Oscillatoria sp. SIO1A7]|nr:Rpn family recombination-promoting nuclease/putative transposase [Oscillatoria sp. SIO1A7]
MKTDTIFDRLFQVFPGLLFELLNESPSLGARYQFSSREVKELARRFDGVFVPIGKGAVKLPIYFVEVQFKTKTDFYWRLFGEIFLYLSQYQPKNDWAVIAIFAKRSMDPGVPQQYRWLSKSPPLYKIYLDELKDQQNPSLGLGMVKLVLEDEQTAASERAGQLIQKARSELSDEAIAQKAIELIETIMVYKLPNLSREEIEAMFGLEDLKKTRYFQEVAEEAEQKGQEKGKLEGKLESVPGLLAIGLSAEQIAGALGLDVELVMQAARDRETNGNSDRK